MVPPQAPLTIAGIGREQMMLVPLPEPLQSHKYSVGESGLSLKVPKVQELMPLPQSPLTDTAFTVRVKEVVFVKDPAVPVTVTVYVPAGVEAAVLIVKVDEQLGTHDAEEKDEVAPVGKPETEKKVDCDVPETRVAIIPLETEPSWSTDLFPAFDKEKL